ncbi:hypothetical protein BBP40_007193 [Aspergillus hancockii]|nr:hypothetical protein BBP40_007193 [Aspergillus hancockii]
MHKQDMHVGKRLSAFQMGDGPTLPQLCTLGLSPVELRDFISGQDDSTLAAVEQISRDSGNESRKPTILYTLPWPSHVPAGFFVRFFPPNRRGTRASYYALLKDASQVRNWLIGRRVSRPRKRILVLGHRQFLPTHVDKPFLAPDDLAKLR